MFISRQLSKACKMFLSWKEFHISRVSPWKKETNTSKVGRKPSLLVEERHERSNN